LIEKPERNRPLGNLSMYWGIILKYIKKILCEDVNSIHLAQDMAWFRAVLNICVP
jgi:hypothetical protein